MIALAETVAELRRLTDAMAGLAEQAESSRHAFDDLEVAFLRRYLDGARTTWRRALGRKIVKGTGPAWLRRDELENVE